MRGTPRMRWEDWVKRDLERVGGEWRTTAKHRRRWRPLIENALRENGKNKTTVTKTKPTPDERISRGAQRLLQPITLLASSIKTKFRNR